MLARPSLRLTRHERNYFLSLRRKDRKGFFLASLAYMDVGQGREQDAEALRESLLKFDSFVKMLVSQGLQEPVRE